MTALSAAPTEGGAYTVKQIAQMLGVSLSTVYDEIANGSLVALAIGPGRGTKRVEPAEFEAYKQRCRAKAVRTPEVAA